MVKVYDEEGDWAVSTLRGGEVGVAVGAVALGLEGGEVVIFNMGRVSCEVCWQDVEGAGCSLFI